MPAYFYQARDQDGRTSTGTLEAVHPDALAATLRSRGLLVLHVEETRNREERSWSPLHPSTWLPATKRDVETGMQQLAVMIGSGLPLLAALRTVAEQAGRKRASRMWLQIAERIETGGTLAAALERESTFPRYVVQLLRVGENSGELETMFSRAATHLEETRNLRMMLLNALTYPVLVFFMALGVSGFLVLHVIPKIERFLVGSGRSLPPMTQGLLDFSTWLRVSLPHISLALAVFVAAVFLLRRWPSGRVFEDALLLRVPVVGSILRSAGTAVFARGSGVLLESGVGLVETLTHVEHLVGNAAQARKVAVARAQITSGMPLANALASGREFPLMLPRMIAVGESTGTLGTTFNGVANFYENQVVVAVRRLGMLVEPVMILVVGGIVGFVYTAFFMALFSIATAAGG